MGLIGPEQGRLPGPAWVRRRCKARISRSERDPANSGQSQVSSSP